MGLMRWGGYRLVSSVRNQGSSVAVSQDPWINLDGRLNAPAGTSQFPTLLNTYHDVGVPDGRYRWPSTLAVYAATGNPGQPQFMVAGVDYHVGIDRNLYPTNASLKDPATISDPNVGVDTVNKQLTITGPNVTLDGYDYSLAGGWQVIPQNDNITLSNSRWVVGTNNNVPIWAHGGTGPSNLMFINLEIDGAFNVNITPGTMITNDGPGTTVKYCYVTSSVGDHVNCNGGGFIDIRFNLFKDNGTPSAHPDWLTIASGVYGPCTVNFNCYWQSPSVLNGSGGVSYDGNPTWSLVGFEQISYNTMLNLGGNSTNSTASNIGITTSAFSGGAHSSCHDNFCDPTWVQNGFANWVFAQMVPTNAAARVFNNTNMLNGQIDVGPQFAGTGP
jgi:hypothetical protein